MITFADKQKKIKISIPEFYQFLYILILQIKCTHNCVCWWFLLSMTELSAFPFENTLVPLTLFTLGGEIPWRKHPNQRVCRHVQAIIILIQRPEFLQCSTSSLKILAITSITDDDLVNLTEIDRRHPTFCEQWTKGLYWIPLQTLRWLCAKSKVKNRITSIEVPKRYCTLQKLRWCMFFFLLFQIITICHPAGEVPLPGGQEGLT